MSHLREAIQKLNHSIGSLERAAGHCEAVVKGSQRDMFATPAGNDNDETLQEDMAGRLDRAIDMVEQVLKESAEG